MVYDPNDISMPAIKMSAAIRNAGATPATDIQYATGIFKHQIKNRSGDFPRPDLQYDEGVSYLAPGIEHEADPRTIGL